MLKFLRKVQESEFKIRQALGSRLTYILLIMAIIGLYSIPFWIYELIF